MTHMTLNYLEKLREHGLRMTSQRQAVLEALCGADRHLAVAEVYYRARKSDPGIDRSTVYRTLDLFVRLGIVIMADSADRERMYELVREARHHHLICQLCGHETEIEDPMVNDFYRALHERYDYAIEMDHLIVYGKCRDCN